MKKNYDFSKGEKNPYYKKLKNKKLKVDEEISFDLKDLIQKKDSSSKSKIEKKITELSQRVQKIEKSLAKRK